MKFRIKQDNDGLYFAEYKNFFFFWAYVPGSVSWHIEKTKKACEQFKTKGKDTIIQNFEL